MVEAQLSVHECLQEFLSLCNTPDTLFITERWIAPRLDALRSLLSDPVTEDQAEALNDALYKRAQLDEVIEWLRTGLMYWTDFLKNKRQAEADLAAARLQREKERILDKLSRLDRPVCEKCGSSVAVVPVTFGMPDEATAQLAREGKLALGGCMIGFGVDGRWGERWACQKCRTRF
jgi:hypothetical protein